MSRRALTRAPNPHAAPPVAIATRRDLFGTFGAMLLLSAAEAGPAKAAELDGELLACCAEALAIDAESNRLFRIAVAAGDDAPPDHPDWQVHDAYDDATNPRWHELVEHIAATSARTPEGLRAKATVARSTVTEERRELPDPADTLAWSVLTDVLGSAGA